MKKYRYIKGDAQTTDKVEFDLINTKKKKYETTCIVNVKSLIYGGRENPCTNGKIHQLNDNQALKVLGFVKRERGKLVL